MKVLVFTALYPNNIWPNNGVFIKERMTRFARLDGCEVKVIAPVPYFPALKGNWRWQFSQVLHQEIREGIEVYHPRRFMIPKVGMALYGLMMFLSVLPTVKRIRKDFDFDLIDAHWVYPDGLAAVLLGRVFKKPVIVSARGSDINLYSNFPVIRRLLQYTLGKADKVISVCAALKEAMIRLGIPAAKIAVVPNGVDAEKFHRVPKEAARIRLGLPADKKIILSVGGLVSRKGFDLLIKALNILLTKGFRDLYLVIIGDGECREKLEKLISFFGLDNNVRLTGSILHKDLYSWYSAADLFCLVSSREGWPNVLLESLACGTPVVATKVWGVPEVIGSDEVGLLTERTEQAIAETILLALRKEWRSDDLIEYAKKNTWEGTAWGVRHVFESALARRQNLSCEDTAYDNAPAP
jgi:teichuronic acid biosynthesis glycosyltransferase TuaC